jgi:hypothetical protein
MIASAQSAEPGESPEHRNLRMAVDVAQKMIEQHFCDTMILPAAPDNILRGTRAQCRKDEAAELALARQKLAAADASIDKNTSAITTRQAAADPLESPEHKYYQHDVEFKKYLVGYCDTMPLGHDRRLLKSQNKAVEADVRDDCRKRQAAELALAEQKLRVADPCVAVYRTTIDKKAGDITTREADGIKGCKNFDMYPPATIAPMIAPSQPTNANPLLEGLATNSEASKGSPAAAASLANVGRVYNPQELAELIKNGEASKCAVVTVPPGAEVDIDGNKMGVSPVAFVLLKQGDAPRTVTIRMSGYKTIERKLIPDGKTIPIGLTLEKQ